MRATYLPDRARLRHWATEAWYYGRMAVLTLAALMIVGWMLVTMILVQWPELGHGSTYSKWIARTQQDRSIHPLDPEQQRERWGESGPKNPRVETPYEYWKHHRPLPTATETMNRHQIRGRLATNPSTKP